MKKVDIHKDYTMYNLIELCRMNLHTITSYMQSMTPYSDAYEKAFKQLKKTLKSLEKTESCLQECMEVKNYGKKND